MSLLDRLRAIDSGGSKPKTEKPVSAGLLVRMTDTDMELPFAPEVLGLGRMGWEGPWPDPEKCLFLDTETTGLSGGVGTLAFMVGLGKFDDGVFTVKQYMLRDYSDEEEILRRTCAELSNADVVITFNGKNFDMPLLLSRATLYGMHREWPEPLQMDLLYPAKRLWKKRLGSCKLSVLEDKVLGLGRTDDLPGSEAPERFFTYLKTGVMEPLEDVLKHNCQDVATMPRLLSCLAAAYADPAGQEHRLDLYSLGRVLQRQGEMEEAKECFRQAARPVPKTSLEALRENAATGEARMALSGILRKEGAMEEAVSLWQETARRGQMEEKPYIELAKYYEHTEKDITKAIECAETAKKYARDARTQAEIDHRLERLYRKANKGETEK